MQNLENRFLDVGIVNTLGTLLDPQKAFCAHATYEVDFNVYGTAELDTLGDYFTESVRKKELQQEWMALKRVCY